MATAALGGCKKLSHTVPSPHGPRCAPNKALSGKALSEAQALSHLHVSHLHVSHLHLSHLHSDSPGLCLYLRFMKSTLVQQGPGAHLRHDCVCVFITAGPSTKLFAWGGGDIGGHVLRETTSRGLCGLVCPSRTGTREEPGTWTQGGALFSLVPLVWCLLLAVPMTKLCVCVCLLLQYLLQSCSRWG